MWHKECALKNTFDALVCKNAACVLCFLISGENTENATETELTLQAHACTYTGTCMYVYMYVYVHV